MTLEQGRGQGWVVVNSIVPSSSDLECILIGRRRGLGLFTDRFEEEVAISNKTSQRGHQNVGRPVPEKVNPVCLHHSTQGLKRSLLAEDWICH